ncbi:aspartyl-phosphate phosphatase Spo0E family protein [Tissierella creatinini]|nr:aspartyl-phosphate phosphatase Spo0E family protein [Tissierella creatinini]TJX63252.1 aspartyl-phosphate phosphatase Spo0E family protein [Soehngenia saccharolytica]
MIDGKESLKNEIEALKKDLNEKITRSNGDLKSTEIVKLSQKLDDLINKLMNT